MATKIVTKNSSTAGSAPSASDLVQGELAVNVVDKRLYTENNSGAIVELGTNPAGAVTMASTLAVTGNVDFNGDLDVDGTTNLDVVDIDGAVDMASTLQVDGAATFNSTVTADGLTVEGEITGPATNNLTIRSKYSATIDIDSDNNQTDRNFQVIHDGSKLILKAEESGDVSFYEDTGTTPKFFWDASAEYLGLGTASPDTNLHVYHATRNGIALIESGDADVSLYLKDGNSTSISAVGIGATTDDLTLRAGNAERMRIDSAGNVGIGTSTFTGANTFMDDLVVYNATAGTGAGLSIIGNATNGYSSIAFGDTADWDTGRLQYNHADNSMAFHANSAEAMRIDSSGNLLVGKTSYNSALQGGQIGTNGIGAFTTVNAFAGIFNRTGTDGSLVDFRKDGAPVGSIGVEGSRPYFANDDTGGFSISSAGYIIPATSTGAVSDATKDLGISGARFKDLYLSGGVKNTSSIYMGRTDLNTSVWIGNSTVNAGTSGGAARDNAVDLGYSGSRWKNLYLSGGVYLGGTGAANKLDSYEEGTWTPTLYAATTGTNRVVAHTASTYTKIGRLVICKTFLNNINGTALNGDSGTITLSGLPFTPSAYGNLRSVYNGLSTVNPTAYVSSAAVSLLRDDTQATLTPTFINTGTVGIMLELTFETAA